MQQITKEQVIVLETIAKKAAILASTSLSKFIHMPVQLELTRTRMIEVSEINQLITDSEEISSVVLLPVTGDFVGSSALISSIQDSYHLAEILLKRPKGSITKLDELATSAIKETANIIGGAFLSTLSNTTGFSLIQSIPNKATGTMKEIVDMAVKELHHIDNELTIALEIDFSLSATTTEIITHYVFFLDVDFAQKLLEALQKSGT